MEVSDNDPVEPNTLGSSTTFLDLSTCKNATVLHNHPQMALIICPITSLILKKIPYQARIRDFAWSREQALNELLSLINFVGDKRIPYKMWAHFHDLSEILAMKKQNAVRFVLQQIMW